MGFVIPPQYLITTPQSICYYDYREAENVCVKKVAAGIKPKKIVRTWMSQHEGIKTLKGINFKEKMKLFGLP